MTGLARPQAQQLLGRFLFSGWGEHEKQVRALGWRAATAVPGRRGGVRGEPARAGRADEPSRPREPRGARGGARGVSGLDPARLARPRAARRGGRADGRDRGPALRSYDGGWADLVRARGEAEDAPPSPSPKERKPKAATKPRPKPARQAPTELAQVEAGSRRSSGTSSSSSRSSQRTGRIWTCSPRTGRPRRAAGAARALGDAVRASAARVLTPRAGLVTQCHERWIALRRCDGGRARRRRTGVHTMTLTRPLPRTATPTTFAEAAERHLDDVFGYLLYLTRDRALADDLSGVDVREGAAPVAAIRPASRQRPHMAARDRSHDRARLVPRRVRGAGGARRRPPRRRRTRRLPRRAVSRVAAALATLTAGEREVLALRIVIELDGEQTARVLGISPTAVSTRLSRALTKLEQKVRDDDHR